MSGETDFWHNIRQEFELDPAYIHLSNGMIASHPRCVKKAITNHRDALDRNPVLYVKNRDTFHQCVLNAAAKYLNTSADLIALTESTTMGLGLIYHGLRLTSQQEVLTTCHDHYATQEALETKCQVSGAVLKQVELYQNAFDVDEVSLLQQLVRHITEKTRVVAVTWVHSCSGVKLPIEKMGGIIQSINANRPLSKKILFCVDGIHALGIEDIDMEKLGCDFFIAGCHKSLFGPRGTGLVWGTMQAWQQVDPIIPSFDSEIFLPWLSGKRPGSKVSRARLCNPGGFTVFEHRWALDKAFEFHLKIGKSGITHYVHEINYQYKRAMLDIPHLKLHTSLSQQFSSGIICFEIAGKTPSQIVEALFERNIIAGQTPYATSYARFMPGIYNTAAEIDRVMIALRDIALA